MIGAAVGCAGAYEAWRRRRAGQLAVVGVPAAGATVTALQPRPVGATSVTGVRDERFCELPAAHGRAQQGRALRAVSGVPPDGPPLRAR